MRLFGYPYNDLVICKDSPDYLSQHRMFSRPPGKFPFTSNILHLYLNTAEHSFLQRDVMYCNLGRVSMLSAFLFYRMFVFFDLFWLSASSSLCFKFSRVFKWSISTLCCMQVPVIFFSQIEFFIWLFVCLCCVIT